MPSKSPLYLQKVGSQPSARCSLPGLWWSGGFCGDVPIRLLRSLNPQACREVSRLCRGWKTKDFLMSGFGPQLHLWGQAERKYSYLWKNGEKLSKPKCTQYPWPVLEMLCRWEWSTFLRKNKAEDATQNQSVHSIESWNTPCLFWVRLLTKLCSLTPKVLLPIWTVAFLLAELFCKKFSTFSFLNYSHRCTATSGTICLCKECVILFCSCHGLVLLKWFQNEVCYGIILRMSLCGKAALDHQTYCLAAPSCGPHKEHVQHNLILCSVLVKRPRNYFSPS